MALTTILQPETGLTQTAATFPPTVVDDVNQSVSGVPDSCIILGLNATIPWDNPHNLVSMETERLFDRIKSAIVIPALFLVGFPANCINMAVFFRQGLRERINLCLFSLALVDLICLTEIFAPNAERIYTQFTDGEPMGPVLRYMVNNNVIGLYGFLYGSMFLYAIISVERCVCILFPLRARTCISTKAIAFVTVAGVLTIGFGRFAITAMYQVSCFREIRTQRITWKPNVNDYYFRNKAMISALDGLIYGGVLTVGCPVIVMIATTITAVKLTQVVRWRSQTSSSLSSKEIDVTKMLIVLSIEFFVLSIPFIVLRIASVFEPRLRPGGVFSNAGSLLLGLSELCSYTSATVNFFVYCLTGTKYRKTLRDLSIFCQKRPPTIRTNSNETTVVSIATVSETVASAGTDSRRAVAEIIVAHDRSP